MECQVEDCMYGEGGLLYLQVCVCCVCVCVWGGGGGGLFMGFYDIFTFFEYYNLLLV